MPIRRRSVTGLRKWKKSTFRSCMGVLPFRGARGGINALAAQEKTGPVFACPRNPIRDGVGTVSTAVAIDSAHITNPPLLYFLVRVQRDTNQYPASLKSHSSRSESKVNDNDPQHVDAFPRGRQNRATGWYSIQHCNDFPVENGSPPQRATWVGQR